jgi:hypothetical protein
LPEISDDFGIYTEFLKKSKLRDLFLKSPLEEKRHEFWYHTDEKN